MICSAWSYWFWKWVAFEYQLSILSGTVLRDMIYFMSRVGILAVKKLMRSLWSVMPAQVVLYWKVGLRCNCRVKGRISCSS